MARATIQTPPTSDARFKHPRFALPAWVAAQTGLAIPAWEQESKDLLSFQNSVRNGCALLGAKIDGAENLPAGDFRQAVTNAYTNLLNKLDSLEATHAVRFWNFLPPIRQEMGGGQDRYMVFNAGRFAAFESRFGGPEAFDQKVATASAIGHDHSDLFIYCLAVNQPGRQLANPRQIAPYRYSPKFGPLPPCFARATTASIAGKAPVLLVGGTASIHGEESLYEDDLEAQFEETVRNLSSLIESASPGQSNPLGSFRELRVYHPREMDLDFLIDRIRTRFENVARPEFLRADLCRAELLVEIEGVAELGASN